MNRTTPTRIPNYYLYGDRDSDVELDFLHVEPILDRSGPNGWRILAHAHPEHLQIILLHAGGGTIRLEDQSHPLPVPCILVLPEGCVHQFEFDPGTDGYVVTAALGFMGNATIGDPRLAQAVARPAILGLTDSGIDEPAVIDTFDWLLREFVWSAPGRRAAITALFMRLLVIVLRLGITQASANPLTPDRDQDLLIRYRAMIERQFRHQRSPSVYAAELAVTTARLNAACKARTGRTASELLHQRILLEAKRYLLYTDNSVAQIAHMTGFDDPAYFNRFFAQRAGISPGQYRKQDGTD
ncbi:helix-turn-helix domain-containing protein [Paracoccus aestuariivivens]|uniref:Helix-turn-helix domain-containing protein n=1 Tax=Paracoccus aestuariivivens TaxID=1820333 RepID=A0A6L6J5G1_9RHOB|nr:helix-turn-helix domain-containing protein [Paracoccus aestuariivivens]MTH77150.1 helix-turn-helix domain-containing protein [Paracoccus aestuariivivens]